MRTVAVWTAFVLAYSSSPFVAGIRYIDSISAQSGNTGDIAEKHVGLTEPTCDELRAMWRYTKRQSRAAKTSTGYPLYHDPFSYNDWKSYSERSKLSLNYRGRLAGNAPIYGRMVHKAPAGSRLRNGMRHPPRLYDKSTRFYGTINSYPPSPRRKLMDNFRMVGGGFHRMSQVPQAGRFQYLKELLHNERARELQKQHRVENLAEKTSTLKDSINDEHPFDIQQPRKQFSKSALQIPTKINYEFGQGRYTSNVPNNGQVWSVSNK
ncbi:hypothetical protein WN48_05826, partial [Eufriesea mexicana]